MIEKGNVMKIKIENKHSKLNTLLLVILLLTSVDTVMFGTNSNQFALYFSRIIPIVIIVILFINNIHNKVQIKLIFLIVLMVSIVSLSGLVNYANFDTILSKIIVLITAFFIVINYQIKDFFNIFSKVLYGLSVISIIVYLLAALSPFVFGFLPIITNQTGQEFSYFIIGGVMRRFLELGFRFRNSSIFWEPGAFAVYICLALYIELFEKKNPSLIKVIVFIISVFTTFSTTGYIGVILLMIIYVGYNKNRINIKTYYVSLILMSCFVITFITLAINENSFLYLNVFQKIFNNESTSITRYSSLINGIQIGIDYPFLGVSPNKMSLYMAFYASKTQLFDFGSNPMNTNTMTYQFAAFGLIFGLVFAIGTFKFFIKTNYKKWITIALFVYLLLLYSGENFYSFLPYTLMFYGYKKYTEKRGFIDV